MNKAQLKKTYTSEVGAYCFLIAVCAMVAAQLVLLVIFMIFYLAGGGDVSEAQDKITSGKPFLFTVMALNQLAFMAVAVLISKFFKIDIVSGLNLKSKPTLIETALCLAISLVCVYFMVSLALIFQQGLYHMGYNFSGLGIEFKGAGDFVLGVIIICILAPIGEELIYRGLLLKGLESRFKPTTAILLSALAFMLMHGNPEQTVHQFLLGIIMGYMTVKTQKLYPAIILHAFNNFLALLQSYVPAIGESYYNLYYQLPDFWAYFLWAITGVAGFVGAMAIVKYAFKKNERVQEETAQPQEAAQEAQAEAQPVVAQSSQKPLFGANDKKRTLIAYGLALGICAVLYISTFLTAVGVIN